MSDRKILSVDLSGGAEKLEKYRSELNDEQLAQISGGGSLGYQGEGFDNYTDIVWKYNIGDRVEMYRGFLNLSYAAYVVKQGWYKRHDGKLIPCYKLNCPEDSYYNEDWYGEDDFCFWSIITTTIYYWG